MFIICIIRNKSWLAVSTKIAQTAYIYDQILDLLFTDTGVHLSTGYPELSDSDGTVAVPIEPPKGLLQARPNMIGDVRTHSYKQRKWEN